MVTHKDFAMKWLQQAVRFSEEPNKKKFNWLRMRAMALRISLLLRDYVDADRQFPDAYPNDYLFKVSEELKRLIAALAQGFFYNASPAGYEVLYYFGKEENLEGSLILIYDDHAKGNHCGLSIIMLQIMATYGIHVLGRCEACGEIMFAIKKSRKKTCDNACRQKLFRKKMDPEKKRKGSQTQSRTLSPK